VRQLGPEDVNRSVPVQITGVVTYYEAAEHILFVQDRTGGIFIRTTRAFPLHAGDRVRVRGFTALSYRTVVASNSIKALERAAMPAPPVATFPELMAGTWDSTYVTISGRVLSATLQKTAGSPFLLLELRMDGGTVDVHLQDPGNLKPRSLLDSRVLLTGVSGGRFDGKFHLIGANFYLSSRSGLRVVSPAPVAPYALPFTPISKIMSTYNVDEQSPRVRVRGTITLYEPGEQFTLEENGNAVLVHTHENAPLRIGDVVYATGFAEPGHYAEALDHGQFFPAGRSAPVQPQAVSWQDVLTGRYAFNLISLKGRLIQQVHEPGQDTLFINSGGHVFSSVLSHRDDHSLRLPQLRNGSVLQVSGVCFIRKGGPWGSPLGFELHLRDAADVRVLSPSSWWTFRHLIDLIGVLGILVLADVIWGSVLRRRIRLQTRLLRRGVEAEAIRERRQMSMDKERSRVLEAINSRLPLDQVLAMITDLISEQMDGLQCWCEVAATGAVVGAPSEHDGQSEQHGLRQFRRDILSSTGERLGSLVLLREDDAKKPVSLRSDLLDMGVSLAALAIDNRRLYEDLVRRSEYDPLTEVPNRFHLEERLSQVLACARLDRRKFAIIYVDLDRFKAINDAHGHHVGDMYLQNVAKRLADKLRAQDTLARVGGDEFIVLLPVVRSRAEAEDVASRLAGCFDSPFRMDGLTFQGSASIGIAIYPEDGINEEQLMRVADSAMYASKHQLSWLGARSGTSALS
jgi:diguanylate cyclase (GGDEF)-like protein